MKEILVSRKLLSRRCVWNVMNIPRAKPLKTGLESGCKLQKLDIFGAGGVNKTHFIDRGPNSTMNEF